MYVKDLSILGRDLKKTIIVDNIRENFERQEANGIEIKTWVSDPADKELENLMTFLNGMIEAQVKDVRPLVNLFKANYWKNSNRPQTADINATFHVDVKSFTPQSYKKGLLARLVR